MHEYPIDGELDLHTFDPSDVDDLVPEYLRACHEKGLPEVRIIHGKGTGSLRRRVRSLLDNHPLVDATTRQPMRAAGAPQSPTS